MEKSNQWIDVTAPGKKYEYGHLHILTQVQRKINEIFSSMGFEIAEGPEIETEYYNFDALNIPAEHPARDMWDTLWLRQNLLLRTHTSPVQIRYMEAHEPPIKIIVPGRTYRYEATDATHEVQFHQLEGLMIDKDITLSNLKAIMETFFKKFFSKDIEVRFKPSFFPFVEPGVEVDMKWGKPRRPSGSGLRPKASEWIEIAGAGMVHPQVLLNVKLDPKEWRGFAFGLGIDRLAMIKYKINDIRLFYSSDLRFIKQF